MLYQAHPDAPDSVHHLMVRGIERWIMVRAAMDCADSVARLAPLGKQDALSVDAGAVDCRHPRGGLRFQHLARQARKSGSGRP
jgi:hypothetical protein